MAEKRVLSWSDIGGVKPISTSKGTISFHPWNTFVIGAQIFALLGVLALGWSLITGKNRAPEQLSDYANPIVVFGSLGSAGHRTVTAIDEEFVAPADQPFNSQGRRLRMIRPGSPDSRPVRPPSE